MGPLIPVSRFSARWYDTGSKRLLLYPNPARPRSGPTPCSCESAGAGEIFGHPSWPKGASRQGERACLRPQAEFARASGRGLSRVGSKISFRTRRGCTKKMQDLELTKKAFRKFGILFLFRAASHALVTFLVFPRKVTQRRAPDENFLTACSVILGTFRKLALRASDIRNASPSDSVARLKFSYGTPDSRLAIFSEMVRQWV